jgi:hypothetical protein
MKQTTAAINTETCRIEIRNAYPVKDELMLAGYRWDAGKRVWWKIETRCKRERDSLRGMGIVVEMTGNLKNGERPLTDGMRAALEALESSRFYMADSRMCPEAETVREAFAENGETASDADVSWAISNAHRYGTRWVEGDPHEVY